MKPYLVTIVGVLILAVVIFITSANYFDCKYSTGGEGERDRLSTFQDKILFICK